MSRRLALLMTCGAAALACAGWDAHAQDRASRLRGAAPAYLAQPPAPEPRTAATLDPIRDAGALVSGEPAGLSRRAPPLASRPVQGAVRGVTQRRFRAQAPMVTGAGALSTPPPPPRRTASQEDPYAPLGLRLGAVTLRPGITNSIGFDNNPQRISGPERRGSGFSRHEADLDIQSDWNVHELRGRLRGGYTKFFRDDQSSRPDGEGTLDLRLDASRDTRILLESRLRLDTQRPGSPDLTAAVTGRPAIYQYGASAGISHDINRLQLSLRGSVDRSDYEDAQLTSGAKLSQRDRNLTQTGIRARAGYELTPGLRPFVQGEVDARQFDQAIDDSGFRRSSTGLGARLGTTFEITRQLGGEVSVGYQDRAYDDKRLRNLRGLVGDAAILWSPTPLTTVTLRGTAELGDTTIPGSSGTTARRANLEIAHALRRNLTVTGFGAFGRTEYDGQNLREDFASVGARMEYKLTRSIAVRASFTHERLNSTAQGSDYTANVAQVGLRLQF